MTGKDIYGYIGYHTRQRYFLMVSSERSNIDGSFDPLLESFGPKSKMLLAIMSLQVNVLDGKDKHGYVDCYIRDKPDVAIHF